MHHRVFQLSLLLLLALAGRAVPAALVPLNLALNKPATASSSQSGNEPGNAVDGDTGTRWCGPDGAAGHWWQVDLGKPEDITSCRIIWEGEGSLYQYKITSSPDSKTWSVLVDASQDKSMKQEHEHKFDAKGVRFLRVTVTGLSPGRWGSFWEFEVFGKQMVEAGKQPRRVPSLAGVKVPAGFTATMFASPPDVRYPTCIATAPSGEVFVGMDENGSLDAKPGRGHIIRCVDTDGDGVADRFNTFADADSPRGIVFDNGTLYVCHPPSLEAFYDEKGVGTANRAQILVKGIGRDLKFRGADHTTNGMRMGIDGWLYVAVGDYGFPKAEGKDGRTLELLGGGIFRVRPDGTELELVVKGTRNIYDVAIDPLMNIFTCDNTNDGDDWNLRLSYMVPTGVYGYPSLFRHFSDEMIPTMMDYGGGSPTGATFVDEPLWPDGFGYGLYTCQWGWSNVTRHALTADGATFKPGRETFVTVPRPTGIDVDGRSHLFVASWNQGGFNYSGANVGYVIRVAPTGDPAPPFPDLKRATDAQLVQLIGSPSAFCRMQTQHEILRRGDKPVFAHGLEALAAEHRNLGVRVAAIFTLKQLLGERATDPLLRLATNETIREFALRALADRIPQATKVPTKVFTAALADKNPRVRLQAVIALNRLGRHEAVDALMPLVADVDPTVAHAAVRALVALHGVVPSFKALDAANTQLIPGAVRVLQESHDGAVVDGLIARLERATTPTTREPILKALCRLYFREADWDGVSWWGTRPDTSGPYFKTAKWDQSAKIELALQKALAAADEPTRKFLLAQLQRHKIEFGDTTAAVIKQAMNDPAFRATAVGAFVGERSKIPAEAIPFLESVAVSEKETPALRAQAFNGLLRATAWDAVVRSVLSFGQQPELVRARQDLLDDGRLTKNVAYFAKLADTNDAARRELAYSVLSSIAKNNLAPKATRETAAEAARKIKPDAAPTAPVANRVVIDSLTYEQAAAEALKLKGDAKLGGELFVRQGCVKCHTITKSEAPKGPFLGDVAVRYNRAEIIESILKPSAKIAQGFEPQWFETSDGEKHEGFIARQSATEIEIRNAAGIPEVLELKDIVKRGKRDLSIMPEGLAANLTTEELAALLRYLESLAGK